MPLEKDNEWAYHSVCLEIAMFFFLLAICRQCRQRIRELGNQPKPEQEACRWEDQVTDQLVGIPIVPSIVEPTLPGDNETKQSTTLEKVL